MYIISACLLGHKCKYNGGDNYCRWVVEFASKNSYIAVCPEVAGGLSVPRPPAEIVGERVLNKEGLDVTEAFMKGAQNAYNASVVEAIERKEPIDGAILRAKSPTCGCKVIYDGTFGGKLVPGDGVFAGLLKENGIRVITEEDSLKELE